MDDILHFAYTGEVCVHDGNVRQLLATSRFLQMNNLKEMTTSYLEKKLNPSSAVDILLLADKHKCENLLAATEKVIIDNFVIVSKTEGFKKMKFEMIHMFIQSEYIRVSKEEEVYEAVMLWVKSDFGNQRLERISQLPNLLREIRFALISPPYITEMTMDPTILENSECYDIVTEGLNYHGSAGVMAPNHSYEPKLTKPRKLMETVLGVISVGGWDKEKPVTDVYAFVESKKNWFPLKSMPTACYGHSVVNSDGLIYVIGGRDENAKLLTTVTRFDPATNDWRSVKNLPYALTSTGVCIFKGQIYVVGGISHKGSLKSVLRYSSRYNVWQKVANLKYPRGACTVVTDGKLMYAIGGMRKVVTGQDVSWEYLDSMEIYDKDSKSWTMGKDLLNKRAYGTAVYTNKKIYLTGGQNKLLSNVKGIELYDTMKVEWVSISYFGIQRSLNGIALNENTFFLVGGISKDGEVIDSVEVFDMTRNRSTKVATLPKTLSMLQCCTLPMKLAVLQGMDTELIN
ncbi:kelch-like protein 20 [Clytia hemisphaerica]|uniref:BACK domain-containing protein n=1 Tax=Clytia hemisphaerica TaxID=252671 RepID=A0A7M5X5T9_9CNID